MEDFMMRNKYALFGILALAAVTGFFLAGCASAPPAEIKIPENMMPAPGESLVTVQRVKSMVGEIIKMQIWIDGEEITGSVINGGRRYITVPDGEHTIQAGSSEIDQGNQITFTANSEVIIFQATPAIGVITARFNLTEISRNAVTPQQQEPDL
jgi:hypothetical protein